MNDTSDQPTASSPPRVRLQRFLAACGLGSRRHCEEFITTGRVTVDGTVADELGVTVDPSRQKITFDGEPLRMERKKYYIVNKPPGYLCTHRDPAGRKRVVDLFPPGGPRLFTVGRLDESSQGLIIVTNDGHLAQQLAHPKFRIYRTYHVQVAGFPTRETLGALKQGFYFSEGKFKVKDARTIGKRGKSAIVELVLTEGQNREIRRLLARVGHKVMKLQRVAYGPVQLGRLALGEHRELRRDELEELFAVLERNRSGAPAVPRDSPRDDRAPPRSDRPQGNRRASARPPRGKPPARAGGKRPRR